MADQILNVFILGSCILFFMMVPLVVYCYCCKSSKYNYSSINDM
jgi:hypothetical protein